MKRIDPRALGLMPLVAALLASCTVFNGLNAADRSPDAALDTGNTNDTKDVAGEEATSDTAIIDTAIIDTTTNDAPTDTDTSIDTASDATITKAERYRAAVLADSPLLYLRLDEATGKLVATDSSSGKRDCTYLGAVELQSTGAFSDSKAVRLTDTENVECAVTPFDFAGASPFTVEAWVNADTIPTDYPRIVSKEVASPRSGYSVSIQSSPLQVLFERWDGGSLKTYVAVPFPGTGRWVHVAASWDGTTAKLFVDGAPASKGYSGLTFSANTSPLTFGLASSGVGGSFRGSVDEIAVYPSALPSSRIAAHISAAVDP
ncbi:LamG domain-containing protein [Gemmatimonas sp.]|uniref:LamG domain-containing protein n=1 Tax=Gemmatimonas sp. TaxID=1962908 RepID=UPI0039838F65